MTPSNRPAVRRHDLAAGIGAIQERLADRAHAAGDAYARACGWTVTPTRGRFGMPGRAYRDPRFAARAAAAGGPASRSAA